VADDQREAVRAELTAALAKVTYESGTPVFLVRDFKGPTDRGDFVVEVQKDKPTKVVLIDGAPYDRAVTDLSFLSGGHNDHPPGVFFAAGPHVDPSADVSGLSIKDIAPTMLYGLGLPVGDDFVGSAYTHLFSAGYQGGHSLESIESWGSAVAGTGTASDMDEELLEDLRSLGYIE